MKILIDTHIFIWALTKPELLSAHQVSLLEVPTNTILVSSMTIAEIAIKESVGKLSFDFNLAEAAEKTGFTLLDYTAEDALLLKTLPFHHKDPFDRMIISQSIRRHLPLMTNDRQFGNYQCELV